MDDNLPKRLGRYVILREIGKGAMGIVYEGRDPNIDRRVAIKTARRDVMEASGMADEMMQRFLREARAAGSLNHPNIITIYDASETDDVAWIAMEYLVGRDLRQILRESATLPQEEIAAIGAEVCEGLAVAHDAGIVHRDVKPANIMVLENGAIKVTDFGIAHVADSNLTLDGSLIGTPHYMSPEQFMGQPVDARSDLFSVGILLYELLTGAKPFNGEALSTVMHQVVKSSPAEPRALNADVSDALYAVITKALSKRPQDRYQDGRIMARALRECLKPNPDMAIILSNDKWTEPSASGVRRAAASTGPAVPSQQFDSNFSDSSTTITMVEMKKRAAADEAPRWPIGIVVAGALALIALIGALVLYLR